MTEKKLQEQFNCPTEDIGKPLYKITLEIDPAALICGYNSKFGAICDLGDTGAPLFILDENETPVCVYGLASFGQELCRGTRSFFTRVPYYDEWIQKTIRDNW